MITSETYFYKNFKRKEKCFLLSDFNLDLRKYDKHAGTNAFLDSLSSYMFLLYILHPARVTGHSQIRIGNNVFSSYILKEACL